MDLSWKFEPLAIRDRNFQPVVGRDQNPNPNMMIGTRADNIVPTFPPHELLNPKSGWTLEEPRKQLSAGVTNDMQRHQLTDGEKRLMEMKEDTLEARERFFQLQAKKFIARRANTAQESVQTEKKTEATTLKKICIQDATSKKSKEKAHEKLREIDEKIERIEKRQDKILDGFMEVIKALEDTKTKQDEILQKMESHQKKQDDIFMMMESNGRQQGAKQEDVILRLIEFQCEKQEGIMESQDEILQKMGINEKMQDDIIKMMSSRDEMLETTEMKQDKILHKIEVNGCEQENVRECVLKMVEKIEGMDRKQEEIFGKIVSNDSEAQEGCEWVQV